MRARAGASPRTVVFHATHRPLNLAAFERVFWLWTDQGLACFLHLNQRQRQRPRWCALAPDAVCTFSAGACAPELNGHCRVTRVEKDAEGGGYSVHAERTLQEQLPLPVRLCDAARQHNSQIQDNDLPWGWHTPCQPQLGRAALRVEQLSYACSHARRGHAGRDNEQRRWGGPD